MKIAYLVNQYPKVSHSFIRREILALERQGFEVQRISLRGWADALTDAQDESERAQTRYVLQGGAGAALALGGAVLRQAAGAPLRFARALGLALRMGRRGARPWPVHLAYLAEACRIVAWLQAGGARHVHAHFGTNSAEVAMLVNALGGPPYSITIHGSAEFDEPEALHLREKIHHAAFVVAVSSYGRSQLYRWAELADWPKVQVVHCGIEPDFHAGDAVAPAQAARIVCVGRLCEQKGQLLLVDAVGRLIASGIAIELVFAGDGEMRPHIEALVAQRGLQASVRITGAISGAEVRSEILAARALVLPSFAEGLPVVIMEAMALRRPVLSTYVAGIPELVRPGREGWLFPAGDIDALVDALEELLATPPARLAAMGEAARIRVLARHAVDSEVAKLARLFRDGLAGEAAPASTASPTATRTSAGARHVESAI